MVKHLLIGNIRYQDESESLLCNADLILTNYSLLEYLSAFILEPVSDMIMADICNNNYINISCLRLSHVHVLK